MNESTVPIPGRDSPESTADDLRRILGASGGRPPFGFGAQQQAVQEWGRTNNRWFEWEVVTEGSKPGGVEHLVKPAPGQGQVIKITIPPVFGRAPGMTHDGHIRLLDATPLQYLDRLRLQNEWFNDEIKVLGATAKKEGFPSLVISQPLIKGNPPTLEQLTQDMAESGYHKAPKEWIFYNRKSREAIFDARPANFVWSCGRAVPIDAIPFAANEPMHDALGKMFHW